MVIITGMASLETAVDALRAGAADFLTKPVKLAELEAAIERAARVGKLSRTVSRLGRAIDRTHRTAPDGKGEAAFGESVAADRIREQIRFAIRAGFDNILITGETGTGKEVVARELHRQGAQKGAPFIAVNCPSIPDSLIESELFGHRKGAFTGAVEDRPGCFELAGDGTLFLDEIGDLSQRAQASLLRVLETRTLRRVGDARERHVKVRVITATNCDLEERIRQGRFRQDLYYRLNVFHLHLPPLRKRREDIPTLARLFASQLARSRGMKLTGFTAEALEMLAIYDYPGNIRELKNIVERACAVRFDGAICPDDLCLPLRPSATPAAKVPDGSDRDRLLSVLESVRWNRRAAARKLEIPYSTLRYRLKAHGLEANPEAN